MDVYVYSCINKSVKKFEKVNQSNIFLYHVIEKMIFYKFIIFWRIPKSSNINSDFPPTANAQPSKKAYSLYLWPRSKCWIRASRASIQHAATKVTNKDSFILRGRLFGVYLACGKSDFNFFSAVASINLIRFTWFTSLAPGS